MIFHEDLQGMMIFHDDSQGVVGNDWERLGANMSVCSLFLGTMTWLGVVGSG